MPSENVSIIDYAPQHREAFAALNYAWIEAHFSIEDADRASLEHPEETILRPGGAILIAQHSGKAIGTCALIRKTGAEIELAKMAVAESHRGFGVGRMLCLAAIDRARSMGADTIWLESNTKLTAALALYRSLGFSTEPQRASDYLRSNIQMRLHL